MKPYLLLFVVALWLAGCGNMLSSPTPTPMPTFTVTPSPTLTASATPDPCGVEQRLFAVQEIHRLTREFDDAFNLAANTPREQLADAIANLQRIRRETEDERVAVCLKPLKEIQLVYMNTAIQTLMAFLSGAEQAAIDQGMSLARQLHNQYMLEMARMSGATVISPVGGAPLEGTPTAGATGEAVSTPSVPVVVNVGPTAISLRAAPSLDAYEVGMLEVGQSALALGILPDGTWIMVELPWQPGQVAWLYSALVQLQGPRELPVIDPSE